MTQLGTRLTYAAARLGDIVDIADLGRCAIESIDPTARTLDLFRPYPTTADFSHSSPPRVICYVGVERIAALSANGFDAFRPTLVSRTEVR